MKIWGLFDSGNSCYKQGLTSYMDKWGGQHEITSIGLDVNSNTDGFVNLDLSANCLFNKKALWQHLDKLSKPDVILASPPCESWSVASAMKHGNACWVNKANVITTQDNHAFNTERFIIRNYSDYKNTQYKFNNQFYKRINGELTIYNTIEIIKRYQPKIWVIENPAFGRIWSYIENVIGFVLPYKNLTYYSAYGYPVVKPTRFSSNIDLELKQEAKRTGMKWSNFSKDYNTRSNIPLNLIEDIYHKCESHIKEQ